MFKQHAKKKRQSDEVMIFLKNTKKQSDSEMSSDQLTLVI